MKKNKGIVVLLLTAIITVFLCYTAGIGLGPTGTGSAKNIKTGLDLSGGVSITYQAEREATLVQKICQILFTSSRSVWNSTVQKHRCTKKEATVSL